MDRSIENIWKEGFLKKEALIAPQVNNLYNQKSLHLIDRFKRRFKINFVYVIVLAIVHLIIGVVAGVPLTGTFLCLLFIPLIWQSQKNQKSLEQIDKSANSYLYLKAFYAWLQNSISSLGKIYQFFYPLYFFGLILGVLFTRFFELFLGDTLYHTIMNDPDIGRGTFWPVLWGLPVVIMLTLVFVYSKRIFREDLQAVYGGLIHRLEELIKDLEELKK